LLTKSWRKAISINGKKNDHGDAKVIAMFAHTQPLTVVSLQTVKLKEKLTARKLAIKQRTQIIKGGNRELNSVFYGFSISQIRYDEEARKYYNKKIAEGKSPRHARKCVARQLANKVYAVLAG